MAGGLPWTRTDVRYFKGMHPSGIGSATYSMAESLRRQFAEQGNWPMFLACRYVPEILETPAGTWQNLMRPGAAQRFCFAGIPAGKYLGNADLQPPEGSTFLLFVSEEFEILKYGWEDSVTERPGFPVGHDDKTRFGRRLWPQE